REHGVREIHQIHLEKHFRPISGFQGFRDVCRIIRENDIDIIHTHMANDHLIGGLAARRCSRDIPIVRSYYDDDPGQTHFRETMCLRHMTDHLILPFDQCAASPIVKQRFAPDRYSIIGPGVDTRRFDPARTLTANLPFKIPAGSIVAGIVARVQTHRRFEILLDAIARAVAEEPNIRLVIVGRGTNIDRVAKQPVQSLGLEKHVLFAGYLSGDDYVNVLNSFDFQLFLVPGSDRTCRAAREGMALGKPLIVFRNGILPILANDGPCGLVVDETSSDLARAILKLAQNKTLRQKLGAQSRQTILHKYDLDSQASATRNIYERLLNKKHMICSVDANVKSLRL
ncbi:MAG: glycosyltransferase family 4 protein, partial [Candidatus Hydrogenedentes bacterium]|nr:glycosyltransferase family 4 protein [Candidatus Hydrogenedentota bacterium]